MAKSYGLDRPFHIQYLDWVGKALQGDLGRSLFTNEPVLELITTRLPVTVQLATYSLILALLVALPLGVLAAMKQNTWIDRLAPLHCGFRSGHSELLVCPADDPVLWRDPEVASHFRHGHVAAFHHATITLSTFAMPQFMRLTRTGMLDVLESDFIRTARAKGLSPIIVLWKHALRNAVLPVVSLAAVAFGFLIGGSFIVESIFAVNGVGFLALESIIRQDFPVVQSIVVFISFVYIVLTLLSDLINAQLDPRIRLN